MVGGSKVRSVFQPLRASRRSDFRISLMFQAFTLYGLLVRKRHGRGIECDDTRAKLFASQLF